MNTLQRDAELVANVKLLCDLTKSTVQKLELDDPRFAIEKKRYFRTKLVVMQTANRIQDRYFFETAINALITLCIAANDMQDAQRLFAAITINDIRDAVLRAHPELKIRRER